MISYYNEKRDFSCKVYSCDNIRINFTVRGDLESEFVRFMSDFFRSDIENYPPTSAQFKYKNMSTFTYDIGITMTLGYSFNGASNDTKRNGFLDFNPNKVSHYQQFWNDFGTIKSMCLSWEVARIDFAIDIPVKRECLILEKDNRKYSLDMYSNSNKTEYLGRRSNLGYVKLYNKTEESSLDYDLTRLELTIEPSVASFKAHLPNVYDITLNNQLTMEYDALCETDKFILFAEWELLNSGLDSGLVRFHSLGRDKKKKLKQFLLPERSLLVLDFDCVLSVINNVIQLYS